MTKDPEGQTWTPEGYAHNARFVADLGLPLLELLAARPGERVLDLGCGDGALTQAIASTGCSVVGVDASPDMVAAARARGLDARVGDGQALAFEEEFDAVFSNAALHWMREPGVVVAGVHKALKPGGRFVGEFGGHGNVAAITVALLATLERHGVNGVEAIPWYFPTAEEYRALLEAQGFEVEHARIIPRPTRLPTGMAGWLETFAGAFLAQLAPEDRPAAMAEVADLLAPALRDGQGNWTADYVRLRFAAHRR